MVQPNFVHHQFQTVAIVIFCLFFHCFDFVFSSLSIAKFGGLCNVISFHDINKWMGVNEMLV